MFGHDSQTDAKQEHEVFGMEKSLADRVALITGAAGASFVSGEVQAGDPCRVGRSGVEVGSWGDHAAGGLVQLVDLGVARPT